MKKIYSCRRYPPKEDIRDECDQSKVSSVNADMLRGNLSFDQLIQIARNITGTGKFWLVFVIVAGVWFLGGLAFVTHFTGLGIQDEINRRFDANNIQDIIEKTAREQAIKRIDKTADTVIEDKIRTQIAPQLKKINENLVHTDSLFSKFQSEFQSLSEFHELAIHVKNDNRFAFDRLMKISADSSNSRSLQALALVNNLPSELAVSNLLRSSVNWKGLGIDPKTADISMFEGIMPKLRPLHNIGVMETVWEAQHLSKKERIQFLIDIMINTPSLRCLDIACDLLNEESKVGLNILRWQRYVEWWEANKDNYE